MTGGSRFSRVAWLAARVSASHERRSGARKTEDSWGKRWKTMAATSWGLVRECES